ncbi:polysaccharide deacetylase family [Fusarium heterosporum]|uniref:Polysaccharide deacetylase family n=1 Tax=Fusarium heterosporum TaxID=42747 RepID=A0A8H5SU42_FUSHE|nr:polysaccharide deacetylase family [Fusarium heterosporum]
MRFSLVKLATFAGMLQFAAAAVPVGVAITKCTVAKNIALTFDDGPYAYTNELLDQLKKYGYKATFFMNGNNWSNIKDYKSTVQRVLKEGHQLGSHTYSHPDLAKISNADVRKQMTRLEADFLSLVGKWPTYMRPPYFSYNSNTLSVMKTLGYHVINADVDSLDWEYNTPAETNTALKLFKDGITKGGSIALFHDVHQNTVRNLIPKVLDAVKRSTRIPVTVGQCLGDPPANWYKTTKRTKRDFEDDTEEDEEVFERSVSDFIERSRFRRNSPTV